MATFLLLATLTWLLHSLHSLQLAQDMVDFSGSAIWSVIHLHSNRIRGDFRASASGSGGSGVRAMRLGSGAAHSSGYPPRADARHVRMPASRGCRLTLMPAMTGYSPRAEENTQRTPAMTGYAESGRA